MNGKPERWCGRCAGTGKIAVPSYATKKEGADVCPCVRRDAPILAPVRCAACGGKYSPEADGSLRRHGSLGWSCDGVTRKATS